MVSLCSTAARLSLGRSETATNDAPPFVRSWVSTQRVELQIRRLRARLGRHLSSRHGEGARRGCLDGAERATQTHRQHLLCLCVSMFCVVLCCFVFVCDEKSRMCGGREEKKRTQSSKQKANTRRQNRDGQKGEKVTGRMQHMQHMQHLPIADMMGDMGNNSMPDMGPMPMYYMWSTSTYILFEFWDTSGSDWAYVATLFALFVLGVFYEVLNFGKIFLAAYDRRNAASYTTCVPSPSPSPSPFLL